METNTVEGNLELFWKGWEVFLQEFPSFTEQFYLTNLTNYQFFTVLVLVLTPLVSLLLINKNRAGKQRKNGHMLSKKGMHGIIRSQATTKITDLIEDLRYRNIISNEVAREAYNYFGLNLKLSGLLPKQETNEEVKKRLKARGMGHSNDPVPLPDAIPPKSVDATTILTKFGIVKS